MTDGRDTVHGMTDGLSVCLRIFILSLKGIRCQIVLYIYLLFGNFSLSYSLVHDLSI